ncbi:MAG: hypothetical protein AMXMBFR61_27410 [Fimbriimonadales bacterium]
MAGRDARHTGRQVFEPLFGLNPGSIYWIFDTGDLYRKLQGSCAIGPEGRIYFTSESTVASHGKAFGVNVVSGQPQLAWMYDRDSPGGPALPNMLSIPALGLLEPEEVEEWDGPQPPPYGVFFGCGDGRLRGLSPTGQLLWRSADLGDDIASGPVIGSNGRVYVCVDSGGGSGWLCAFTSVNSGNEVQPIWSVPIGTGAVASPAIWEEDGNTYLICVSTEGIVYKVRDAGRQGDVQWSQNLRVDQSPTPVVTYAAIADDGTIYVGTFWVSFRGFVYAVNQDGTFKWTGLPRNRIEVARKMTFPIQEDQFGPIEGSPCIGPGGDVFVGTQEASQGIFLGEHHLLRVVDLGATGLATIIHVSNPPTRVDPTPMVGIKSPQGTPYLVFAPENGYVYAAHPSSGAVLQGFPAITSGLERPGVVMDFSGIIYVGANNGKLYAVVGPN